MGSPSPPPATSGPDDARSPASGATAPADWLESSPLPTATIRDGRYVYVNRAFVDFLGWSREELIGMSFFEPVAPEDRQRVRERHAMRLQGQPVPDFYELNVVRADGARRIAEIFVAQMGADTVLQLHDLTDRAIRQDNLTKLARLGASVQSERSDAGVFRTVAEGLAELGLSVLRFALEGDRVRVVELTSPGTLASEFEARTGLRVTGMEAPRGPAAEEALRDGAAYIDDAVPGVARFLGAEHATIAGALERREHLRRAIVLRIDVASTPFQLLMLLGDWLRPADLPAFRLFGAQVSAALDAARAIRDLSRRNDELSALNRFAVAAGTSANLAELLSRATRASAEAIGCDAVAIYLVDPSGRELQLVHSLGVSAEVARKLARVALAGTRMGEVVESGVARVLHASDYPPDQAALLERMGQSVVASIPLVVRSTVIGVLDAAYRLDREFSPRELEVVGAMGAHFAAAIENARLFESLRRRVADLEAVSALSERVLGTTQGDPGALLTAACEELARAFAAPSVSAYLLDDSNDQVRGVAAHGAGARDVTARHFAVRDHEILGRTIRGRKPVASLDVTREPGWALASAPSATPSAALLVPLESRTAVLGVVVIADRAGRVFGADEAALALTLARHVTMALENAQLYAEARRRIEEISIVHDVGRSLVATLELEEVLDAGVENLARIVSAPQAHLLLLDPAGESLVIRATATDRDSVGTVLPLAPPSSSLAARTFHAREPITVEDGLSSPWVNADLRSKFRGRGYLAVPLVVRERAIGVAVIIEPLSPRRFSPSEVARAAAIANQLAIAVENARLYEDLQHSYEKLARAQARLVQRERLAALGELAAVVAHEVRNPLGVIFNSLGSLRRLLHLEGDAKILVDIMGEESERLNRIVSDLLSFARPTVPQIRPELLDRLLDEVANSALADVADRIALVREVDRALSRVPVDIRLLRQAVLNVTINAVQSMSGKGTLTLRATRERDAARIEIRDTGCGISEENLARIFEPFFTTKATGTGLGLAVVKRIVEQHRGELSVQSTPGRGTTFSITLPLEPGTGPLRLTP